MARPRQALLSPAQVRKLRPISPEGEPPRHWATPLATFAATGPRPPRVVTEVRAVGDGRDRAWHVSVSAAPFQGITAAPKFDHHVLRRRRGGSFKTDRFDALLAPFRPRWCAFRPDPKPAPGRPSREAFIMYRGRRLVPLHKIGTDDRRTYRDTAYPWGCVCKVTSGATGGSGVLIGPRHVLTASHVIDWAARWAMVEVHRFDGTFSAGGCVYHLWSFTEVGKVSPSTVDEDYAVLVLSDRLGDQFGWMGAMTYDSGWDDDPFFRTIGYANDLSGGSRPVHERDFHLDEDEFDYGSARVMTCGADLMKGQSGSPIFAFGKHDDMPYVVAVASAGGDDDNNYCAGGSLLTRLVREARQKFP